MEVLDSSDLLLVVRRLEVVQRRQESMRKVEVGYRLSKVELLDIPLLDFDMLQHFHDDDDDRHHSQRYTFATRERGRVREMDWN